MVSEPNFVYMDFVRESFDSPEGDDDKVYLFFSENAMEYDFYSKVAVSRVARVCKVKLPSRRTVSRFHQAGSVTLPCLLAADRWNIYKVAHDRALCLRV